ncbi:MAG TPA: PH domain-containing protein [Tepidisphaeraceae bacterium]|jgi:hypothetical protein|nr:PH domain-containing protein [Tepidisphaeraceae bacterium]
MLDYQRPSAAQRNPTLEVLDQRVCLTIPGPPRWIEIAGVSFWGVAIFSKLAFVVLIIFMIRPMSAPVAIILSRLFAPLFLLMAVLLVAIPIFGISLYNILRFGGTPQRLEVLNGELTYSRRGWVGIRRRQIPADEVASIRFKPWKDVFLRKPRSGILRITSRDGRRIRIGMNGAAFALSADAVIALRRGCGLPEQDDGV